MASSDKNSIQRVSGSSDRPASQPNAFTGTVTAVKNVEGKQTLDVQYTQGRIRLQADGDFQLGEKIRMLFSGNGNVQVERNQSHDTPDPTGSAPAGSNQSGSYTLPQNLASLRDFEEGVVKWMAEKGLDVGAGGADATGAGGAPGAGGSAAQKAGAGAGGPPLAQLTLPQLLVQVMSQAGGEEFLSQAAQGLDRNLLGELMDALDKTSGDPSVKAALQDLLKAAANSGSSGISGGPAADAGPKNLDGRWSAEAGSGASPWFGRILEKDSADAYLSPMNRLQFGAAKSPSPADPMYRYLLDVGDGRTMDAYSTSSRQPGEFAGFQLEKHGDRMQANFSDAAASLPAQLRGIFNASGADMRQALSLSAHYLAEFQGESYFPKLVQDFADVLAQSGRLGNPNVTSAAGKSGTLANAAELASTQGPAATANSAGTAASAETAGSAAMGQTRPSGAATGAGLPDQKELDGLLKLFVAFPRDARQPEKQARAWVDAARNPQAMLDLLKNLRPEKDGTLLRAGTPLRVADAATLAAPNGESIGGGADALASLLKKILPTSFQSNDLLNLVDNAKALLSAAAKDADPAKFLLQSLATALPKEDIPPGQPSQFYYYQGQEWRGLQVTWEKGGGENGRGKNGPKAPLQVRVETQAKHMGQVKVGFSWEPTGKGAKLDFKNQFHNVRELLSQSLPELEKSLSHMDFRVASWTYETLPDDVPAHPVPGWTRPTALSDGSNLDLFG